MRQAAPRPDIVISGKNAIGRCGLCYMAGGDGSFGQPWKQDLSRYLYLGVGPSA